MKDQILTSVQNGVKAIQFLEKESSVEFISRVAKRLVTCFKSENKAIIAGNGGSLCDAMHFAEELTGYFRSRRRALPAIALADASHITCVANDTDFGEVFARGVEAYGKEGDVVILLSTSGNSPSIVRAAECAKERGLVTVSFLGKNGGGRLKGFCDEELIVDGFSFSDRIQEAHMTAMHIIIEMVEQELFFGDVALQERACLSEAP